jgi:hypothetical protein
MTKPAIFRFSAVELADYTNSILTSYIFTIESSAPVKDGNTILV